jgi:putative transposase
MPHSYSSLYVHGVFATYERRQLIQPDFENRVHAYINGIIGNLGGRPLRVNGMADHLHLLAELPARIAVSDAMNKIKTNSSSWIRENLDRRFNWQRGYGAFSVSRSGLDTVIAYIENQKQHHATRSFEDEYRALLKAHGIPFEDRFLWT